MTSVVYKQTKMSKICISRSSSSARIPSSTMKFSIAFTLVVVAMATAEPPRPRPILLSRQQASPAPYEPRGWRPSGAEFTLPQREYGVPTPSYGPPAEESNTTEPVIAESDNSTESQQVENSNLEPSVSAASNSKAIAKSAKLSKQPQASVLLFLPQRSVLRSAAFRPVETVPEIGLGGFQRIQALPLRAAPVSSAVSTSIFTPYNPLVQFVGR